MIAKVILQVGRLPLVLRRIVGTGLGALYFVFPTKEKQAAIQQIARHLSPDMSYSIAKRVFRNLGVTVCESIGISGMLSAVPVELLLDGEFVEPHRIVSEFSTADHSYLALTGHTGNWDFLAAYFSSLGMQIAAIGRRANRNSLQTVLERVREQAGITTLWRDDTKSARQIIETLKGKSFLAALLDQDIDSQGISVAFFGEPARYASGLVNVALKLRVPMVSVFGVRLPSGGFRFFIERFDSSIFSSEEAVLKEYGNRLERIIREFPDQWVWNHKRWRTLPDGRRRSSNEYLEWLAQSKGKV